MLSFSSDGGRQTLLRVLGPSLSSHCQPRCRSTPFHRDSRFHSLQTRCHSSKTAYPDPIFIIDQQSPRRQGSSQWHHGGTCLCGFVAVVVRGSPSAHNTRCGASGVVVVATRIGVGVLGQAAPSSDDTWRCQWFCQRCFALTTNTTATATATATRSPMAASSGIAVLLTHSAPTPLIDIHLPLSFDHCICCRHLHHHLRNHRLHHEHDRRGFAPCGQWCSTVKVWPCKPLFTTLAPSCCFFFWPCNSSISSIWWVPFVACTHWSSS